MLEGVKRHGHHVNAFFVGAMVFAGIILVLCAINLALVTLFPDRIDLLQSLISWWLPVFIILPPVAGIMATFLTFRRSQKKTAEQIAEEYKKELQSIRLSHWPSNGKLINFLLILGIFLVGALAFLGAGLFSLSGDTQASVERGSLVLAIAFIYLGLLLVASIARSRSGR